MLHRRIESDDGRVVACNVFLVDDQIPIKDIQELALDPTDITFSKDTGCNRPVDVLESGIIRKLDQRIRMIRTVRFDKII